MWLMAAIIVGGLTGLFYAATVLFFLWMDWSGHDEPTL